MEHYRCENYVSAGGNNTAGPLPVISNMAGHLDTVPRETFHDPLHVSKHIRCYRKRHSVDSYGFYSDVFR